MAKIWFQLTGTHHREHPESILFKDGRFCIYAEHTMGDQYEQTYMDYVKRKEINFNSIPITKKRITPPPAISDNKYPEYSWVYDNKASSVKMWIIANQIIKWDSSSRFIVFATFPMESVLHLFESFKRVFPDKSYLIYYKRFFWENEIGKLSGQDRTFKEGKDGNLDEHFSSKEIENKIIEISDKNILASSINTYGSSELDTEEEIIKINNFREKFLTENPKFEEFRINGKVYELMDGINFNKE